MLIGVNTLNEIIESVILTGRVKDGHPVSIFLIAPPESGKTSVVCENEVKSVIAFTDITGRALIEACRHHPEVSHIVMNDLTIVTGHSKTVSKYLFSIISAMTEEGIKAVAFPGMVETFQHGRRGVICCTTDTLASDRRAWWNRIGLASRVLPICYTYGDDLLIRIKNFVENGGKPDAHAIPLRVPEIPINVKCSTAISRQIRLLSDSKAGHLKEMGIRRLKQYLCLAKGHALRRSWRKAEVTRKDVEFLESIQGFISYTEPKAL